MPSPIPDGARGNAQPAAGGEEQRSDPGQTPVAPSMPDAIPDPAPARRDARGEIDWQSVRQRVARIGRALRSTDRYDPQEEVALLAERARILAQPSDEATRAPRLGLVRVRLGGDPFAVATADIAAVARGSELAPLPGAAPPTVALAAWRGRLLPALDVRPLLGLPSLGSRALLVLRDDGTDAALLVDDVETLDEATAASLHAIPDADRGSGMLRALLPDGTPLLDVAAVLRQARAGP